MSNILSIANEPAKSKLSPEELLIANEALRNAAMNGDAEKVKELIRQGADVNTASPSSKVTPLQMACSYSHEEIVKILLNANANVNSTDIAGWTPLHAASAKNNKEIMQILLNAGANVNAIDSSNITPLHLASTKILTMSVNAEIVQLLLDNGAYVNAKDKEGRTPLHCAAAYGKTTTIITALLNAGAEINPIDIQDHTPLHLAFFNGQASSIELLTKNGAMIGLCTQDVKNIICAQLNLRQPLPLGEGAIIIGHTPIATKNIQEYLIVEKEIPGADKAIYSIQAAIGFINDKVKDIKTDNKPFQKQRLAALYEPLDAVQNHLISQNKAGLQTFASILAVNKASNLTNMLNNPAKFLPNETAGLQHIPEEVLSIITDYATGMDYNERSSLRLFKESAKAITAAHKALHPELHENVKDNSRKLACGGR